MLLASRTTLTRFADDQRGAVAMMFSLALFGVLMFMACAIDIGRASLVRMKLAAAVDAATIFAAKSLKDIYLYPLVADFRDRVGVKPAPVEALRLASGLDGAG